MIEATTDSRTVWRVLVLAAHCVLAGSAALLIAPRAEAAAFRVDARTEASFYEIRSYRDRSGADPALLPRRRIVQYLGLGAFELVKDKQIDFDSSLRLYTDLGVSSQEAARLDGYRVAEADLLFANVSWRNVQGLADFRLGRQFVVDEMDFLPIDGLRASLRTPFFLFADVYGGLLVKGNSLLGTPTFAPDGVRDADQRRLDLGVSDADRELGALEPVFGVKVGARDLRWGEVRLGYRRSLLLPTGAGGPDPFGAAELRTDLERLGGGLDFRPFWGMRLYAAIDYDLLMGRLGQGRVGGRYDAQSFGATLEAMRFAPILSADSIFAYFATGARDEVRARVDYHPAFLPVQPYLQGTVQRFHSDLQETYIEQLAGSAEPIPTNLAHGFSAGLRLTPRIGRGQVDVTWRNGYGGRQLWAYAAGGHAFTRIPLSIDLALSHAIVRDGFNPLLQGSSTGVQLLAGYQFLEGARLTVIGEENFGTFSRSDFRLYALIDLRADL